MPSFRCRQVLPSSTPFVSVEGTSAADAANAFHYQTRVGGHVTGDTTGARFSIVEVDGSQKFLSRVFFTGIGRKGGVTRVNPNAFKSHEELAKKLGVAVAALTAAEGWEGEDPAGQRDTGYRPPIKWEG